MISVDVCKQATGLETDMDVLVRLGIRVIGVCQYCPRMIDSDTMEDYL